MSLKNNINSLNSNFSFDNYKIYLSISVGGNFYAAMESNIKIAEAAEHNRMFLEKFNDKEAVNMQLIEWEVNEDGYEEQIIIPKEQRNLAAEEGISTENKQKVAVWIQNLKTGETYTGRLPITGNHQLYLPAEIQKMLKDAGQIRIQLL